MKNLYTSMMALACAGTMLAISPAPRLVTTSGALSLSQSQKKEIIKVDNSAEKGRIPFVKNFKAAPGASVSRAASRAMGTEIDWTTVENPADLETEYKYLGEGYFYDQIYTGIEIKTAVYESVEYPGLYRFDDAWSEIGLEEYPAFYVDATDPDMVIIPMQPTGMVEVNGETGATRTTYIMNQAEYFHLNYEYDYKDIFDTVVKEDINVTFQDNYFIDMPAESLVFYYPETGDCYAINEMDIYGMIPVEGYQLVPQWGEEKECTMLNNMVDPLFVENPAEQTYGIQFNNWVENKAFRVLSAYKGIGNLRGTLEVVISNPGCVLVGYQNTDIIARIGQDVYTPVYVVSWAFVKNSIEEFLASLESKYNITLDEETGKITFPSGCFLFDLPNSPDSSQGLSYYPGLPEGWIQLPSDWNDLNGVKDIESDVIDTNAPKAYYNLQGVQVANPTAGQVYIVKQGSKVTKQVIR